MSSIFDKMKPGESKIPNVVGNSKTDGGIPKSKTDDSGNRVEPGFEPLSNEWYGDILESHPDYTGNTNKIGLSSKERFDVSNDYPNFKDDIPDPARNYSTRDYYRLFNDTSTDYFKHGLHVIDGKTPLQGLEGRESWDGHEEGTPLRLSNVLRDNTGRGGTPYENNDPVLFGFEIVIDAVNSPLLNGSVENFIEQFGMISEVAARRFVISDFKNQFIKFFKTKGNLYFNQDFNNQIKQSISTSNYANSESTSNIFESGRKAYMSYYLKKIGGLENLIESNSPSKKKYLTDYRNDVIKLTFDEDVSSSVGTLSHLYKLLYWSKTNGKYVIPDNLLRFNCDIIISEVRNLNRVRKAIDTGELEVIKDNVSRYVYSLRECQLYFDLAPHNNEIDLSQPSQEFNNFVVTMDYKYVSSKFERWVPDNYGFGKYVGYNNGAMWKIGNPGFRDTKSTSDAGTVNDNSVPKFFTVGLNPFKENGISAPISLKTFSDSGVIDDNKEVVFPVEGPNESSSDVKVSGKEAKKQNRKQNLEDFKQRTKVAGKNLTKKVVNRTIQEVNRQMSIRLSLLNNTLDKIRNSMGIGRMREPSNVYKYPNSTYFYDIHNALRDFGGDSIGGALGGMMKGGNNSIW
jgi:hypothetical protein